MFAPVPDRRLAPASVDNLSNAISPPSVQPLFSAFFRNCDSLGEEMTGPHRCCADTTRSARLIAATSTSGRLMELIWSPGLIQRSKKHYQSCWSRIWRCPRPQSPHLAFWSESHSRPAWRSIPAAKASRFFAFGLKQFMVSTSRTAHTPMSSRRPEPDRECPLCARQPGPNIWRPEHSSLPLASAASRHPEKSPAARRSRSKTEAPARHSERSAPTAP